jgi:hypothetical protein
MVVSGGGGGAGVGAPNGGSAGNAALTGAGNAGCSDSGDGGAGGIGPTDGTNGGGAGCIGGSTNGSATKGGDGANGGGGGGGGWFGGGGSGPSEFQYYSQGGGGGGSSYGGAGLSSGITITAASAEATPLVVISWNIARCVAGLTTHVLTATYATGAFYGLFCVNANGDGTYTQYSPGLLVTQQTLTGTGHIRKNQGVTTIQANLPAFKNLNLVGSANGTVSSFGESGSGFPTLNGTFTLT